MQVRVVRELTERDALFLIAQGWIVLECSECRALFEPKPLLRYGDHACPCCNSTNTGFVTEETL